MNQPISIGSGNIMNELCRSLYFLHFPKFSLRFTGCRRVLSPLLLFIRSIDSYGHNNIHIYLEFNYLFILCMIIVTVKCYSPWIYNSVVIFKNEMIIN